MERLLRQSTSLKLIFAYWRERYPVSVFLPFAILIAAAGAAAGGTLPTLRGAVIGCVLAYTLVLVFRIGDDVADLHTDRLRHPNRVLVQSSSLTPIVVLALAIAAGAGDKVARIYWHSVEFGLALEDKELKILGAGLASSFGEAHFSLESREVQRLAFSVERAMGTPYRHDAFQPRYLLSRSLDETIAEVLALTPERLLAL